MKKHTSIANSTRMRLVVLMTLGALLLSLLCGCASGGSTTTTVSDIKHGEDNSLSEARLEDIAEFLAKTPKAYEAFVAAYRGYDMTEKDFDLTVDRPAKDPAPAVAVSVLDHYDQKDTLAEYDAMNEADMLSVIDALRLEVDIEGSRGFMDTIQYGIGVMLRAITNTVGFGHYLVGLCLFAIVVEILMLPFSIKQQKNSIKQAGLRPKEAAIRKKYAGRNDQATQQKMMTEIQEMYQKEGYSPMGGCLPLLVQMPIIMILYNIVVDPIRYVLGLSADISTAVTTFCGMSKAAGGLGESLTGSRGTIEALSLLRDKGADALEGLREFLFISNHEACYQALEAVEGNIPSFNVGSLNFGLIPTFTSWLVIVPILTFVVYFVSMKLSRKFTFQPQTAANDAQAGCSNNIMDITMPLMSVYIAFITPAAIGVYWMFRSVLNTIKQFVISRVMPLPTFTEEDYRAAEKEIKGKGKTAGNRGYVSDGTKPRSLHHIDDEDYEQPAPAPAQKKKKTAPPAMAAPLQSDEKDDKSDKSDKSEQKTAEPKPDSAAESDGNDNMTTNEENKQ